MDETEAAGSGKVFLSYARADRGRIAPLAAALKGRGLDVWWDDHIEGGQAFAHAIEAALDRADAVVVAWSATSARSDWVRDEAGRGLRRGCLIALSLDGTDPPLGFGQIHAIDFSKWRGSAQAPEIDRLIRALDNCGGVGRGVEAARPAQPSRRAMVAGLGAVGAAAAAGGFWLAAGKPGFGGGAAANSIAVLPFRNPDPAGAYFSEGVAEELRAALSRIAALSVAAQTSSNSFRGTTDDAETIARKLGVAFLLEGSVRRSGNVVRIAADLIDGATGFSRWSQSFERRLDDIFQIQSDIAATVAEALRLRLAAAAPAGGATRKPAAYDLYLKGRSLFNMDADEATDRAALAAYDAALAIDPNYGAVHAARSRSLGAIGNLYATGDELDALYDQSITAARRGITLAPELADAHLALGYALFNGRMDVRGARAPYERARALGAGNADVLILYALYSARVGRFAAATEAVTRAAALDRLNSRAHRAAGNVFYAARRYSEAIPPMRRALALSPSINSAHGAIGDSLLMLGRLEEARAAYEREKIAFSRLTGLAIVERKLGDSKAAEAALAELLAEHGDNALYQLAQVRSQWGDREAAIAALERARKARDSGLVFVRNDPLLDPIRNDSRFARLIAEIGFA